MLRPATPLSIIFFVAFVLLLLTTLSTPVIKAIPIGTFQGYNFGVFGYCKADDCTDPLLGYSTDGLFSGNSADQFSLPSSTRHSLSSILIVHPVAALLCLICFGLAVAAHLHAPSHSPRYLLALLILTVPTLLVTLLAFLVDILLFVPHMAWGGWIVLAATILIIASSVVTCAMRRTLVSRKARKKRIAENAEMSGQNYYENMATQRSMSNTVPPPQTHNELPRAESPPPMAGTMMGEKGAEYAAFEMQRQNTGTRSRDGDTMGSPMDDRAPLNPTPSIRSGHSNRGAPYMNGDVPPPMPMAGRPSMDSQGRPSRPSRDDYGNPLPPPGLRHHGSQGSLGSQGSFGSRGRGRGGFGPPPRGYAGPRGGYGGPPRGGYGPRGGYRGGPPPPGFNGRGRGGYGPPPGGMAMGMRGPPPPRPPPPGYANDQFYAAPPQVRNAPSPAMERGPDPYVAGPGTPNPYVAGPSAPDPYVAGPDIPIGTAIEMDERTGSPPVMSPPTTGPMNPSYGLRDSDADVDGMVGLQQDRRPSPLTRESSGHRSPTSVYSQEAYFPPRQQWQQPTQMTRQAEPQNSEPMSSNSHFASSGALPLSPIAASPPMGSNSRQRGDSGSYYEDVDPRFAVQDDAPPPALTPGGMPHGAISHLPGGYPETPGGAPQQAYHGQRMQPPSTLSSSPPHSPLTKTMQTQNPEYLHPSYSTGAGAGAGGANSPSPRSEQLHQSHLSSGSGQFSNRNNITPITGGSSQEDLPEGARSPAQGSERASEASHFTSISQRPVNPNWRPAGGPGGPMGSTFAPPSSASAVQRRREDVILNGNPDFSLPGVGRPGRGGGGGMMRGRGGGGMRGSVPPSVGLTPGGRYPTEF